MTTKTTIYPKMISEKLRISVRMHDRLPFFFVDRSRKVMCKIGM